MRKSTKIWLAIPAAVLAVGIVQFLGGDRIFSAFFGARHDPVHDALTTAAITLRPSLPKRIDEMTELIDVSVAEDTITYELKLDDALPAASIEKIKQNIQAVHQRGTCADPGMSAVVRAGGTSAVTYIFKGNTIATASVSHCP